MMPAQDGYDVLNEPFPLGFNGSCYNFIKPKVNYLFGA